MKTAAQMRYDLWVIAKALETHGITYYKHYNLSNDPIHQAKPKAFEEVSTLIFNLLAKDIAALCRELNCDDDEQTLLRKVMLQAIEKIELLLQNSSVTSGWFKGGFFRSRTENILEKYRDELISLGEIKVFDLQASVRMPILFNERSYRL